MRIQLFIAAAVTAALLSWPVQAAEKTVVLKVDNATCELCGPIVKRTLSRIWGVKAVQIAEARTEPVALATVVFDDGATSVPTLTSALTNAGYPAHLTN
jgi:periplasmic mercuric ion binding protein